MKFLLFTYFSFLKIASNHLLCSTCHCVNFENADLTYIEMWTGNFCYGPVAFLNCRSGGPENVSRKDCTLVCGMGIILVCHCKVYVLTIWSSPP